MRTYLSFMILTMAAISSFYVNANEFSIDSLMPSWNKASLSVFGGVENFRGIPDAEGGNNYGVYAGFNAASPLPKCEKTNFGVQIGGSIAALDFAGRGWHSRHKRSIQGQEFLTVGFFLRTHPFIPINIGIVYDCMFNQHYSIFAENPILHQIRGQIGHFITKCDEIGLWGTYDVKKTHKIQKLHSFDFIITYRPIAQANIFWRHLFGNGIESNIWFGVPLRHRLNRINSNMPGKYIVGLEFSVPFFEDWMFVGKASYMQPGTRSGVFGEREYTSSISFSLVYFFGGNPNTTNNFAWLPYLPVADNSNFFVDAATKSRNFRLTKH